MKRKVYIIDMENVGRKRTIDKLRSVLRDQASCAIICYSPNTCNPSKILYDLDPSLYGRIIFHKCSTGKKDEMDIQLAAMLGVYCTRYPQRTFIVMSDDKGYVPAVEFLRNEGFKVSMNKAIAIRGKKVRTRLP